MWAGSHKTNGITQACNSSPNQAALLRRPPLRQFAQQHKMELYDRKRATLVAQAGVRGVRQGCHQRWLLACPRDRAQGRPGGECVRSACSG